MELTQQEVEVIVRMLDFCEENWSGFIGRCEEAGLDSTQVDLITESIRDSIVEE